MKITDYFSSPSSSKKADRTDTPDVINIKQSMSQSGKSVCTTIQTPKKRRERFTDPELHVLVDTVLAHIEQLYGAKSVNVSGKATIWDTVVHKVNRVGGMRRTVVECKKRWYDYKRKVKQATDKMKEFPDEMESLLDSLPSRQKKVALFFKMNEENMNESKVTSSSSTDEDDFACSGQNMATPIHYDLHSEDEFIDLSTKPFSPAFSIKDSPQDGSISQSQPTKAGKGLTPGGSPDRKSTNAQLQFMSLEAKFEQLIAQQQNTNELLRGLQSSVTAGLELQKKTNLLLKNNFVELQKSILSSKAASSAESSILDVTLKGLRSKVDEISNSLHFKHLQELMSSDESEGHVSVTRDLGAPSATPALKRPLKQGSSSTGLIKKKKMINCRP